ncbi:MAG: fumarate hydratase [Brevinematales bacterium]|nr:fumarate hydratase [Brevinematales bacterium]
MKRITRGEFENAFRDALVHASFNLRPDVLAYFKRLRDEAAQDIQKETVNIFIDNSITACAEKRGVCQDTGYVQLYLRIGADTLIDCDLQESADRMTAEVYSSMFLRASIADPITRRNTETNTPVFVHTETGGAEGLDGHIMIKGGGSENLTRTAALLPTLGKDDIAGWAIEQVLAAGSKGCPPYLVGVGIGGTFEKAVHWSKRVLLRTIGEEGMSPEEREIAGMIKAEVNRKGKGFQGMRFAETVMDVQVRTNPCHIATLPVAVSIGCNAVRQARFII